MVMVEHEKEPPSPSTFKPMGRVKETSRAALSALLPIAVAEGWTGDKLGAACHCGRNAALKALKEYRHETALAVVASGEGMAQKMRGDALAARARLMDRARRVEAAFDRALEVAEREGDMRAVQAAAGALAKLWAVVKDASGAAFAEDVARAGAVTKAKAATKDEMVDPWAMEFETIEEG